MVLHHAAVEHVALMSFIATGPASSTVLSASLLEMQVCESGIHMSRDKSIKPWSSVEAVQSQQLVRSLRARDHVQTSFALPQRDCSSL